MYNIFCRGTRTVVVQFDYISVHSIVQFYPQLQYYTILWLSVASSVDVVGCGGWLAGWMNGWESLKKKDNSLLKRQSIEKKQRGELLFRVSLSVGESERHSEGSCSDSYVRNNVVERENFLLLICGDFFECFSDEEQPLPCGWLVVAQSCCARHQSPQLPFANSINVWPNTQKNCGCRECM